MASASSARSLGRLIESIRRQSFDSFELLLPDDAPAGAASLARQLAEADVRIKPFACEPRAGLAASHNRALGLARGEYFRWLREDDELEPSHAGRCVSLLDGHPEAIGVTNLSGVRGDAAHVFDQPSRLASRFRVDSPFAHERFARCLWLLARRDTYGFDPTRAMHRRAVLERTFGLRPILNGDQLLAAELSLLGPYVHVPEVLEIRARPEPDAAAATQTLAPSAAPSLAADPQRLLLLLHDMIQGAALTRPEKLRCYAAALAYVAGLERARWRELGALFGRRLRGLGRGEAPGVSGAVRLE